MHVLFDAYIDFNRISGGDPYEEFNRMMLFTRRFDTDFSRGQIDGYFNSEIPDNFFDIMAFHTAMKWIATIVWMIHTNDKVCYDEMLVAKDNILKDYCNFTNVIPSWYHK